MENRCLCFCVTLHPWYALPASKENACCASGCAVPHVPDFSCAAGESEDQQHRPEGVILLPLQPPLWNISCHGRWNLSPLFSKHCPVSRSSSSCTTAPGCSVCIKQPNFFFLFVKPANFHIYFYPCNNNNNILYNKDLNIVSLLVCTDVLQVKMLFHLNIKT